MVDPVMYASNCPNARTPPSIFEPLRRAFDLQVDMAATKEDALLPDFVGPDIDSLKLDTWGGVRAWCNPPWGKKVKPSLQVWCRKFRVEASEHGSLVVALLPGRIDTRWFQDDVLGWARVLVPKGRVTFLRPDGTPHPSPAPFPIAICIWAPFCTREEASTFVSWDWKRGAL